MTQALPGSHPGLTARRAAIESRYPHWQPRALHEHLDALLPDYGERPYIVTDELELTYADVAELSRRYAEGLRRLGVRPGDRVGILLANYPELPALKYALSRLGAVAVGFNFQLRSDELAYVLGHSGCSVLITMSSHDGIDYLQTLEAIEPGWRTGARNKLTSLREVVVLPCEDDHVEGSRLFDEVAASDPMDESVAVDPFGPSDILYTSGTTGVPKAVVLSHDSLLRNSFASALSRGFDDGWRVLFSLPLYHVFGYAEGLLATTWVGGAVMPRLRFSATDYLRGVERHRANDILCVPTMTIAILEEPDIATYDLDSLRAMFSAAAPSPEWVWTAAAERLGLSEMVTGYGMTELCGAIVVTLPEDPIGQLTEVVGRMKFGGPAGLGSASGGVCEFRVVDQESGEELGPGQSGELTWRGPVVTMGFWDGTAVIPVSEDGWLRSGDLGYVDERGYFRLTGRSKDVYKSGGELVLPVEVETFIGRIEGVAQCYVVGVPDDRWGEVGWAYVVPSPGHTLNAEDIIAACKASLARFKVPKEVVIIDAEALPKTATGKVQKFRLTEVIS
ncbi:class I adenylate-forming enzyme family protein [Prauserella endophytica]|uniref:Acyl--CoA ligase n=1 Tax=Prauserella endophytica TaxID=1592324 RepID=A0ABY2RU29_9PSEU|nr:class I adenylate-forming enzyme family protein [Prauserella endophytica]TKG60613.1 acyl--CoA ligase [Prauserella endophytica]